MPTNLNVPFGILPQLPGSCHETRVGKEEGEFEKRHR